LSIPSTTLRTIHLSTIIIESPVKRDSVMNDDENIYQNNIEHFPFDPRGNISARLQELERIEREIEMRVRMRDEKDRIINYARHLSTVDNYFAFDPGTQN